MRLFAIVAALAALGTISGNGIRVTAPAGWHRVAAFEDVHVTDPLTALVVGTAGVRPRMTGCQIAAYVVPPRGAVVVIVRWKRGHLPSTSPTHDDVRALARLTSVRANTFECFGGRGAVAQVALGGHVYQVNVMVGERASPRRIADALAVARSFRLAR